MCCIVLQNTVLGVIFPIYSCENFSKNIQYIQEFFFQFPIEKEIVVFIPFSAAFFYSKTYFLLWDFEFLLLCKTYFRTLYYEKFQESSFMVAKICLSPVYWWNIMTWHFMPNCCDAQIYRIIGQIFWSCYLSEWNINIYAINSNLVSKSIKY